MDLVSAFVLNVKKLNIVLTRMEQMEKRRHMELTDGQPENTIRPATAITGAGA